MHFKETSGKGHALSSQACYTLVSGVFSLLSFVQSLRYSLHGNGCSYRTGGKCYQNNPAWILACLLKVQVNAMK